MGRPKGSKNKIYPMIKRSRADKQKQVESIKQEIEAVEVNTDSRNISKEPEIKIVPRGKVCECSHDFSVHYGGLKGHCNTTGCRCGEYKCNP